MKNNLKENTEWFEEWFDSPYYHILYKNRDHKEAKAFISNLINYLAPSKDSILLDVACGKGRHSVYMNKLGFSVDGFDLSVNSIKIAKEQETDSLHFYTNDIRNPLKINHYHLAFNLFTSFGYFEKEEENRMAINSITESLKENGLLVLDFMNCKKVIDNLSISESKTIDGIVFNINRGLKDGFITKDITFVDNDKEYHFQEKVKAISLDDFKSYFAAANLKIEAIFGDYELNFFNEASSDRLILIARK